MSDRYTADSITSDALDQLYARMERAEHLVESFDAIADTWLRDGTSEPTKVAGRYLRRVLDEARPPSGPAATQATEPHTGLVVQPYRNDRGENAWVFRCWGTDTCDGWLSLDHYSEQSAERARDRHITEEHGAPGPAATEEQDLARALGGDRTAQTIAHTLTIHGHTLNAVRTMTYAELLAVPGIGGTSLARIRAALDGVPEPEAAATTEPEVCGAEPPREIIGTDGRSWTFGDCWCTRKPHRTGEHRCQPCTDRHGAPAWTDEPADEYERTTGHAITCTAGFTDTCTCPPKEQQ